MAREEAGKEEGEDGAILIGMRALAHLHETATGTEAQALAGVLMAQFLPPGVDTGLEDSNTRVEVEQKTEDGRG